MAQDAKIMAAAHRRFQADREARQAELERRIEEIHRRLPRVEAIDRELGSTAARLVLAAFEAEGDPGPVIQELEKTNLALQRERAELLVGAGYPYDYIDGAPQCARCQDSGYLPSGAPCQCLTAYYAREQNRRLSRLLDLGGQSFDTFSFDWYDGEVWSEFGASPLSNMELIYDICRDFARQFQEQAQSLLLTGPPGLGKTFLSACVAREVSEQGFSVVYDTAAHVFQQFESGKFGRENPYEDAPEEDIERCLRCDLLIMDDLGTEMVTPFVRSALYRIVNERLLGRKKTVLSTNLTVPELGRQYGAAVQSRLEGEYQVLQFFGRDIRLLKRDQ